MSFGGFAFRAFALGAALAMGAACGGIVSRNDMCTASGSGSTGGPPQGACGATEQPPGAAHASAASGSVAVSPVGTTAFATTASASTGWTGSSIRVTSTTAVPGKGTSTTSLGQEYSQNAPLPTGDPASSEVTCYGNTDGTSCSVSDINFATGTMVRTVICSAADARCSCQIKSPSGTGALLLPFAPGLCPMAAAGGTNSIGSLSADACTSTAAKLFALCGW